MLQKMSDAELENRLKRLVKRERRLLHLTLEHIKEVSTRRLYLERAYPSLYDYLVKELGYSGSAAMRRLEAAQLLREVPSVAEKVAQGSLNLSQIGELSRAIKEKEKTTGQRVGPEEKKTLVQLIEGDSVHETQKKLSMALDLKLPEPERTRMQKDDSLRLEITLSKEQHQKLMQCKDKAAHLLAKKNGDFSWASVIETLADRFLKQKEGKGRTPARGSGSEEGGAPAAADNAPIAASEAVRVNKRLTPKKRQMILDRDSCCQYVDPSTGRRCASTFGLEVDHRRPLWAFGRHHTGNLQALCGQHNRHKYRQEAGLKSIDRPLKGFSRKGRKPAATGPPARP